jgi:hypothetical protein
VKIEAKGTKDTKGTKGTKAMRRYVLLSVALGLVTSTFLASAHEQRSTNASSPAVERAFADFWKADDPRDAARAAGIAKGRAEPGAQSTTFLLNIRKCSNNGFTFGGRVTIASSGMSRFARRSC